MREQKIAEQRTVRILHLEDNRSDAELIQATLCSSGLFCDITRVQTGADFKAALERNRYDLIISDFTLPSFDGLSALSLAEKQCPETPFIFVSGTIGEELAVEALKQGATDYVLKDRPSRLVSAVERAFRESQQRVERQRMEEQLREKAALLDKAQDAICVTDIDQRVLYWNKGAERLYGWAAEEAVGRNATELLFKANSTVPLAALKSLIARDEWKGELHQVTKGNREIVVESRWTLLRTAAGKPKSILVINSDLTEKKLLEAQFLRAQRPESVGALASGIAHDLNNALSPILMVGALLRKQLSDETSRKMLDTAESSARRGSEMIRQILSFTRGAAGEKAALQMKPLMLEMVRLAGNTFPKSIRIETKFGAELHPVMGDATQLHQVLMNLCVNARDAMPNGGVLRLEAENDVLPKGRSTEPGPPRSRPCIRITVADAGTGIPPHLQDKIFDPFFTTKEPGKGTGLGLSTVRTIIEQHGGSIELSSDVGQGTTFKVYLPAVAMPRREALRSTPAHLPRGHGETILVIDDEMALRDMTREMLESFDYKVFAAANGAEGVGLYRQHQNEIGVVLTDMMMPIMDGPATIRALREINPAVKVIGVSGIASRAKLTEIAELNLPGFLTKPFATEKLLTTLRRVLAASPA